MAQKEDSGEVAVVAGRRADELRPTLVETGASRYCSPSRAPHRPRGLPQRPAVSLGRCRLSRVARRRPPPRSARPPAARRVALPVAEREGVHAVAVRLGNREHGGRVEPAAQEDDGVLVIMLVRLRGEVACWPSPGPVASRQASMKARTVLGSNSVWPPTFTRANAPLRSVGRRCFPTL